MEDIYRADEHNKKGDLSSFILAKITLFRGEILRELNIRSLSGQSERAFNAIHCVSQYTIYNKANKRY